MARTTVAVTNSWQQIASGEVLITIVQRGKGAPILFNEIGDDANANSDAANPGDQFQQDDVLKDTYVRSDGEDWVVLVDETL